jgi:hypothetical protein
MSLAFGTQSKEIKMIRSRLTLSAAAFLFALGTGIAFAAASPACLANCKAEFEDCLSQASKPGCVAAHTRCKAECGA